MNYIIYDEWENLCELKWETGDEFPDSDRLFITCDHISEFMRKFGHLDLSDKTIVSAASDYGPVLFENHPPYKDLYKWIPMCDFSKLGMRDCYIPARLDQTKCLGSDKYAMRSYSWTHSTMNKLPPRWFCTNNSINGPINIPFGISRDSIKFIEKNKDARKENKVMVCFSDNTNERFQEKKRLSQIDGFNVFSQLDPEEYFYQLARHSYIRTSTGNGLDSFRILESLYVGSTPLVDLHPWSSHYQDMGVCYFDSNTLKILNQPVTNAKKLDFSYWSSLIRS